MRIADFIFGTILFLVGGYILYVMNQTLSAATPGFSQYGWTMFLAYVGVAVIWIKSKQSKKLEI